MAAHRPYAPAEQPEMTLEQHFTELIGALGEDDVTQRRRLQGLKHLQVSVRGPPGGK